MVLAQLRRILYRSRAMTDASFFCDPLWNVVGVRADFVTRVPGVEPSYEKEEVLQRLMPWHERALSTLGFSWEQLRRAEQVHGAGLAVVGKEGCSEPVSGVDGLLAAEQDICLGIYVADCAPVYVVDRKTRALALLHSGRKGSELNITGRAIECMGAEFGSEAADLIVVIGPCIRPPHYEMNCAELIMQSALAAGVPKASIFDSGICTAETMERHYSYRMEKGLTGRMLALLGRREP